MIQSDKEYRVILERIELLLQQAENIENENSRGFIELNLLSDLVADYEEKTAPVDEPSFVEVLKLRMYELGLNQKELSEMLEISTSRISEYMNGKSEPTLKVARMISLKLKIDASIILGV